MAYLVRLKDQPSDAMKKLLLTLLLALSSTSAMAEWTHHGGNKDSDLYIDHDSIRKDGEKTQMWFMEDYRGVKKISFGKSFLSAQTLGEYDCKKERVRTVRFAIFSGKMGSGDVVSTSSIKEAWEPLVPSSLGEILWKIACKNK
jgi:hypothetical protein